MTVNKKWELMYNWCQWVLDGRHALGKLKGLFLYYMTLFFYKMVGHLTSGSYYYQGLESKNKYLNIKEQFEFRYKTCPIASLNLLTALEAMVNC